MLSRLRKLWRAARSAPVLRAGVEGLDRLWWARVIRRADVVDLDFLAAATGRRWTRSAAVRAYVRGGFRRGMTLNPLFLESLVSGQLSDADRVPALYAYLMNDPSRIEVSPDWDAPAYVTRFPAALTAPGGPLGHAWRAARAGGTMLLGRGGQTVQVGWPLVTTTAARRDGIGPDGPFETDTVLVCTIDSAEDTGHTLATLVELGRRGDLDIVVTIEGHAADLWAAAALLTLWLPRVRVVAADPGTVTAVEARAGSATALVVRGPRARIDAAALRALADAGRSGPVQPLWLAEDGTIASAGTIAHDRRHFALLTGHPAEDARALGPEIAHVAVAGDTSARPPGAAVAGARTLTSLTVLAPASALQPRGGTDPDTDLEALVAPLGLTVAGWDATGPRLVRSTTTVTLPDGTRVARLRWAIKTAAPAGPRGESWGDTHFARGIAAALRRLGQEVVVDAYPARHRATSYLDDVALVLRGPHRIRPPRTTSRSLLWIISHPDEITANEIDDFRIVFAASTSWAAAASARFARVVRPLLQCTDAARFRPTGAARGDEIVFVGTARGIARPAVVEPIRAGIPLRVYGPDWRGYIPAENIAATGIPNDQLPARYETAAVVLNDHWPAMREHGFISNRPYDVLAAGGRVISDDVPGIAEEFRGVVPTFRKPDELVALLRASPDDVFPSDDDLARVGALVRERDSFDARARTLLEAALSEA